MLLALTSFSQSQTSAGLERTGMNAVSTHSMCPTLGLARTSASGRKRTLTTQVNPPILERSDNAAFQASIGGFRQVRAGRKTTNWPSKQNQMALEKAARRPDYGMALRREADGLRRSDSAAVVPRPNPPFTARSGS